MASVSRITKDVDLRSSTCGNSWIPPAGLEVSERWFTYGGSR
jgi:hypothetical protein